MKVLIKSTKNLTNYYVHAYETWKNALSRFADVRCYGEGYENFIGWDVSDSDIYQELGFYPDVELWCGGPGNPKPQYISDNFITKSQVKSIPKLILLCDYWEIVRDCSVSSWKRREEELREMGVVGYFSFYSQSKPWMESMVRTTFDKFITFPYAYDDIFAVHDQEKRWNINNQGAANGDYPFRSRVRRGLLQKDLGVFLTDNSNHQYRILDETLDPLESFFKGGDPVTNFARLLNSCWITVTDGYSLFCPQRAQWGMEYSDMFLAKYPQTLASSGVLFCPSITSDHVESLEDGVHYVAVDASNFLNKIEYYLDRKDSLVNISKNANDWAKRNCSMDVVGARLKTDLEKL